MYLRQFFREALQTAAEHFEVGVFTASVDSYARNIVQNLDPSNSIFRFLLSRKDCIQLIDDSVPETDLYIKDLAVLHGRDPGTVFLVDNYAHSYMRHLDHGIPVVPYYSDGADAELQSLACYLKCLAGQPDPLAFNRSFFRSRELLTAPDYKAALQKLQSLASEDRAPQ